LERFFFIRAIRATRGRRLSPIIQYKCAVGNGYCHQEKIARKTCHTSPSRLNKRARGEEKPVDAKPAAPSTSQPAAKRSKETPMRRFLMPMAVVVLALSVSAAHAGKGGNGGGPKNFQTSSLKIQSSGKNYSSYCKSFCKSDFCYTRSCWCNSYGCYCYWYPYDSCWFCWYEPWCRYVPYTTYITLVTPAPVAGPAVAASAPAGPVGPPPGP
jgi:hypothetical protein